MIHRILLTTMLLASAPVIAEEPSEQTKHDALLLAFALNGNSMVRWGSIDVSTLVNPMAPYVPRGLPPDLYGPPRPLSLEPDRGR